MRFEPLIEPEAAPRPPFTRGEFEAVEGEGGRHKG